MADALALSEQMMLDVKEEGLAEAGVSNLPDFAATKSHQSTQTATASTARGPVLPSATAAAIAAGMPATPYSLPSLPATPPFETVEFDADKDISATITTAADASATTSITHLMNDTPSDSASEPLSEQAQPQQPATRMYRFRPEFLPARRSPPGQSRDDTDSPEPLSQRASPKRRRSSRKSHTEDSLSTRLAPLSPSTAEDASEPADASTTPTQQTPTLSDNTTLSEEATPCAADDSIATRRPMRSVRQAKPVTQETPRQTRTSPASVAESAKKASPKANTKLAVPPPVERRATRRSGLPLELAPPKPTSLSKRRRSESDKAIAGISRELQRLEDTKEYKHVDEDPVVYTVWSNGKYVPANAAGEPLPDKTKRDKPSNDADNGKAGAGGTSQAQDAQAQGDDQAMPDAPRPAQKRLKKWMTNGLYSGQAMPKNYTSGLTTAEKKSLLKLPELAKTSPPNKALPMPIYNGLRMLLQGRDFKLPFDVFNPLPPGQPKPVKYGRFNKNRFVGDAHAIWKKSPNYDDSLTKCVCKLETGCDEDCQNRIMLYECNDMICNVGVEHCQNREFQRLAERTASKNAYNIGVEVFKTPNRGHGIRASRGFKPGQIIMEYIGEIITEEESDRRMNELYKDNECYYLMSFDQSLIIDGTSGSVARFVNHSCDPNCRMIKWIVSGQPRIALFAGDRTIQTGEELTYDYNFDPYSSKNVQGCLCGSENCRGILGPRKSEKAVSKAAAAAAEKAAAAAQKKTGSGSSKRKHDVYSMDDDDDEAKGGPAAKKVRTASGQPQNSQTAKKAAKASALKAIVTTKAALEALAADAAKKARLEKATKAAKVARAAKAAKAAELKANADRVAKSAAVARAAKAAKAAKLALQKSKSAAASKTTSKTTVKTTKATKTATPAARGTKTETTKSAKPTKVVKAVKSVKVVQTAKGIKATKTSKAAKTTMESKAKTKTTAKTAAKATTKTAAKATEKTTKATAKTAAKAAVKAPPRMTASATEKTKPQAAKLTKVQKPKTSLAQRAETPPNATAMSEGDTTPQATPMAQAIAKAAKDTAAGKDKPPAKTHKSVKFVKKSHSQQEQAQAAAKAEALAKKVPGRRRQVPKKALDFAQAVAAKMTLSAPIKVISQTSPSSVMNEEEELAAQLYLEVASSKMADEAKTRAPAAKDRAGRISKKTRRFGWRAAISPQQAAAHDESGAPGEIEDVSMFDDDRMLLDEPVEVPLGSDPAEDTIHVARRQG